MLHKALLVVGSLVATGGLTGGYVALHTTSPPAHTAPAPNFTCPDIADAMNLAFTQKNSGIRGDLAYNLYYHPVRGCNEYYGKTYVDTD